MGPILSVFSALAAGKTVSLNTAWKASDSDISLPVGDESYLASHCLFLVSGLNSSHPIPDLIISPLRSQK